jgi:DNA-binding FadR family transcriptional regulator
MTNQTFSSDFIQYLATLAQDGESSDRLPSLNALGEELGVSVARLREQLEVAKALGFVEVRPRTGIRRLPYTFFPAIWQSLSYAITLDQSHFEAFASLRRCVEAAFWEPAVRKLTLEDHQNLQELMSKAWEKLRGIPIRIPHAEHRQLHLAIYSRLENPFVLGILEAYWEAYEAAGLNVFAEYKYLEEVWNYHQKMVDAICSGDFEAGHRALIAHTDLLYLRDQK